MSDVLIAILQFPNDPTSNRVAHQMFLATQTGSTIDLYSISSILGKERRVYGSDKDDSLIFGYNFSIANENSITGME